jgi:hypothetical protein
MGKWVWRLLVEEDSFWSRILQAKYGQEGGRVRFEEGVGSIWWRSLNNIRKGAGFLDSRWLLDNIIWTVGDGGDSLFWKDPWLNECPLNHTFARLYDLAENKLISVSDMFELGWAADGNGWRWRRPLRAWEEDLLSNCIVCLSNVVLQVNEKDSWVWKLHASHCYTVKSAYSLLTSTDTNLNEEFNRFLWIKSIPLKVNLFVWRLFLNRMPTKDNLHQRGILDASGLPCVTACGMEESIDHLFFRCNHYGKLWSLISRWLGFDTVFHGSIGTHSAQFCSLGGSSKSCFLLLITIWAAVLFTIWKDRNLWLFRAAHDSIESLAERIKIHSFWWLKAKYVLFDFDLSAWQQNPLSCCRAIV